MHNTGGYQYPVDLPNLIDHLKFVSCGKRGYNDLEYEQLLNVFDVPIWMLIMVSLIGATSSISGMVAGLNMQVFTSTFFTCLKVLLEQGTAFTRSYVKNSYIRVIVGCYLLISVVISNAYKNTNIYHMINDREPLKYDKLDELVDDNFSIYTRTAYMYSRFRNVPLNESWSKHTFYGPHYMYTGGFHVLEFAMLYSEMFGLTRIIRDRMNYHNSTIERSGKITWNEIQSHTSLHPLLPSVIENTINYFTEKYADKNFTDEGIQNKLKSKFPKLVLQDEETLLINALHHCNRTAVILPEQTCHEFASDLRAAGHTHVFVGNEIYSSSIAIAFSVEGLVPRGVIGRIKGIQGAGIWEWWAMFAQEKWVGNDGSERKVPEVPTLQGNILVVFVLFLCCMLLALVTFLLEIMHNTSQ